MATSQNNRQFKKLRRLLLWKRHFEIKLSRRLSVFWLFRVGHLVRNSALSLDWHERLSYKSRERKFSVCCVLSLSWEPQVSNFHRLADYVKQLPKMGVPHAPHDYCSSFDQSDHCFVMLSLPSSFLKLRNNDVIIEGKKTNRKPCCIYPVRFFSLIYTTMIEKKHSMSFENTNQRALYDVTSTWIAKDLRQLKVVFSRRRFHYFILDGVVSQWTWSAQWSYKTKNKIYFHLYWNVPLL